MKNILSLLTVLFVSSCVFGQLNFVRVAQNLGDRSITIKDAGGVGNYEILYVDNTSSQLVQVYKSREGSAWNVISTNAAQDNDLDSYSDVETFMYQGKKTIAYKHGINSIVVAQWNDVFYRYEAILPEFTTPNLGAQFDVAINPVNGELYIASVWAITTRYINISHYNPDSLSWENDLFHYAPYSPAGSYSVTNPQICFNNDTLLIGMRDIFYPNDSVMVFKQKYDLLSDTLYPIMISDTNISNANSFSFDGNPTDGFYLATFNNNNLTAYLSKIQGPTINPVGSKTYSGVSAGLVDLFFSGSGSPLMAVSTGNTTTSKTEILKPSGTTLQSIGSNFGIVNNTAVSLGDVSGVQSDDGSHSIINISTGIGSFISTEAYASNTLPTVAPVNYDDSICYIAGADFNKTLLIENLQFTDADNDKVFIMDIHSTNYGAQLVLPLSFTNYTVEQTQDMGGVTSYKIYANNVFGAGTTDFVIKYSDGYDIDSVTITNIKSFLGATPPVTLINNLSNITPIYCLNAPLIDLKQVTETYPGIFYADGVELPDGTYPVADYTGSENFTFSYLDVASGCYANMFIISPDSVDVPTASVVTTATVCDTNTGTAVLTYTTPGGGLKDIYWSAGFHDSTSLSNLYAGQYLVTITDSNDCIATVAANVAVDGITVTEDIMNAVCAGDNNGSIQLTVNGSDAPYTYLWSNGKSTPGVYNLSEGAYQVVITSSSGCEMTKTYNITQPLGPIVINDSSPFPPDCEVANGKLDANPSGGLAPYTFQWSTGETIQQISNLYAGIYHVKVTDALGCSAEKDVVLDDYNTPSVFANAISNPSCGLTDGYIAAQLSDMSSFASVAWSNGATSMFNGSLDAGHYICEATTIDGCKAFKAWDLKAEKPLQNNICMITVDSATNTNLIVWEKVQNNMDHYNIYREGSVAGEFELIDTVSGLNYSTFNDVVASPRVHSWRYQISAVNQCGVEGPLSTPHKTIHLVIAQALGSGQYNISWDKYEGFDYATVKLWRYTNDVGWILLDSLPSNIFSYTDNITGSTAGLDYMIEIQPPAPCSVDKAQDYNSSRSNKANGLMVPGSGTGVSNNGIEEYGHNNLPITMYPNPTTGMLTIMNESSTKTNVKLTNTAGKLIEQFNFTEKTQRNFNRLEAGIYFLHFEADRKVSVKKLIVN